MRPIDADKIPWQYSYTLQEEITYRKKVDMLPAEYMSPHSFWEKKYNYMGDVHAYVCNSCGHTVGTPTRFCDTCGCKMDLSGEEECLD